MLIVIDLDPNLGVLPAEFAAAWNTHPTANQLATATQDDATPKTFNDPVTAAVILTVATGLVTLGLNVLEDTIKDVLKSLREGKPPAGETLFIPDNAKIERLRNHDGSEIITVTIPPKSP